MSSEQNNKLDYYTPDKMTIDEYNEEKVNNNRPLVLGDISNFYMPLLKTINKDFLRIKNRNDLSKFIAGKIWGNIDTDYDVQEGRIIPNMDDVFLNVMIDDSSLMMGYVFNSIATNVFLDGNLSDYPVIKITHQAPILYKKGCEIFWGIDIFKSGSGIQIPKIVVGESLKIKLKGLNEIHEIYHPEESILSSGNHFLIPITPEPTSMRWMGYYYIWNKWEECFETPGQYYIECMEYDNKKIYHEEISMLMGYANVDYLINNVSATYTSSNGEITKAKFSKPPQYPFDGVVITFSNIDKKPVFSEFEFVLEHKPPPIEDGNFRAYETINLNIDETINLYFNESYKVNNLNNNNFKIYPYYLVTYLGTVVHYEHFKDDKWLLIEQDTFMKNLRKHSANPVIKLCKFYVVCQELQYNTFIALPLDITIDDETFFDKSHQNIASVTIDSIKKNDIIVGVCMSGDASIHYIQTNMLTNMGGAYKIINHQTGSKTLGSGGSSTLGFPFFVGVDYYYQIKPTGVNVMETLNNLNMRFINTNTGNGAIQKEFTNIKSSNRDDASKNVINLLYTNNSIVGYNNITLNK